MQTSKPALAAPGVPSRGAAIAGMLITFMGGYLLGALSKSRPGEEALEAAAAAKRAAVPVGLSPTSGPDDALVTIVEFADFQCGACAGSVALRRRVLADHPGTVRWVFKNWPWSFHPQAREAARAAIAAQAQGQFWPFHDRVFGDQTHLTVNDLMAAARALGLDVVRFRTDLGGAGTDRLVTSDLELGRTLGVAATPTFFVNGRPMVAPSSSALESAIREELAWTTDLLRRGVPRPRIYEEVLKGATPAAPPASRPAAGGQPAR